MVYYIVLAIPLALVAIPIVVGLFGFQLSGFVTVPFLGLILRDYIHMGTFGFPLLIIIMYMGALDSKIAWVKKLLAIRKELSIISGFPVLTHSLVRIINNLPDSFKFFTDNAGYMEKTKVVSELGAGISSFSFILGVAMLVLFIPLWVTSFDSVHKRMGTVKWKKLQKWAYVLYLTLFIHAMGIQIGGMLNPREGTAPRPATEVTTVQNNSGEKAPQVNTERGERGNMQPQNATAAPARGGRMPSFGFTNINVSPQAKRYIHVASLILIFGSYLYLRLRRAKKI